VIAAVWIFFHIRLARDSNRSLTLRVKLSRMDVLGTTLFLGAIYCLLLALQWGGETVPWKSARIIGFFIGFGLLALLFGILQWRRGEHATIPLRILRQRSIFVGSIFLLLLGMMSFVVSLQISLEFPSVWLADWTVRILSSHLFPIHSGRLGNPEWCAVYRHGAATDCGTHHHGSHCDPMGILCRFW
jgi:hypothetical protein